MIIHIQYKILTLKQKFWISHYDQASIQQITHLMLCELLFSDYKRPEQTYVLSDTRATSDAINYPVQPIVNKWFCYFYSFFFLGSIC